MWDRDTRKMLRSNDIHSRVNYRAITEDSIEMIDDGPVT